MNLVRITHNGRLAAILDLENRRCTSDAGLSRVEGREVDAIAAGYLALHDEKKRVPTYEEALCFAVCLMIPANSLRENFGKPLTSFTPEELAEICDVGTDFARLRLRYAEREAEGSNKP